MIGKDVKSSMTARYLHSEHFQAYFKSSWLTGYRSFEFHIQYFAFNLTNRLFDFLTEKVYIFTTIFSISIANYYRHLCRSNVGEVESWHFYMFFFSQQVKPPRLKLINLNNIWEPYFVVLDFYWSENSINS